MSRPTNPPNSFQSCMGCLGVVIFLPLAILAVWFLVSQIG
jgi:hypothetical protein